MNCRVVLVRPEIAANVGAAARAMRNFGLSELVLVAPVADPRDERARQLAMHGEDILDRCRVVAGLGEAVAGCVLVAGTSARTGGLFRRQSVGTPDEVMPRLVEATASGPVALVFGPEPSGLENAEVTRCHYLVHIPADPSYPALNPYWNPYTAYTGYNPYLVYATLYNPYLYAASLNNPYNPYGPGLPRYQGGRSVSSL